MSIAQKEIDEFLVVGLAGRTNNKREATGVGIIGAQWNQLFADHVLDRIPNRADFGIVAVYTDYAGDHTGEYTFLLGTRVRDLSQVPDGLMAKRIPAGRYAALTTDKGPVAQVVIAAWQKIWSLPPDELGGERAYQADFEIYDERATDPQNSQVDIYIGLK
jgi:predicted transcriptional regulator YdeE